MFLDFLDEISFQITSKQVIQAYVNRLKEVRVVVFSSFVFLPSATYNIPFFRSSQHSRLNYLIWIEKENMATTFERSR